MMTQHPKSSFQAYLERKRAAEASPSLTDVAAAMNVPVFPCDANKKPLTLHGFKDATTSAEAIRSAFARPGAVMIGVPTGAITGLVIIDVDVKDGAIGQVWLDAHSHLLPQTRTIKTGSGGLHLYFKHPGNRIPNSASKVAKNVDVRGDGGYVIVPPSPGYQVADPSDVAAIPDWLLPALLPAPEPAHTPVQRSRPPSTTGGTPYGLAALDSACDAIRHAHNGSKHDTLNREAYSIGGLVTGQELEQGVAFQALSAALQDIRPACKDFRAAQRTLSQAFRDGMGRPRDVPDRLPPPEEVHPAAGFLAKLYERASKEQKPLKPEPVDPGLMDVDGALKLFIDHCNRSAISPQPFLALGAAISLVGALAGRKYRTTTDLRTNIYTVGIADSGGGKDYARKQIKKVLYAAGLERFLGGSDVASGGGLRAALLRHPSTVFLIDEFGDWLRGILGDKAPAHKAQIASLMKELYSSADTILGGTEYADQSKQGRPKEDIHQPHACLYGTTTPGQFWAAVGGANLHDGLMARLLLFVSPESYPDEREPEIAEPDADLIEAMRTITLGQGAVSAGGNLPETFGAIMEAGRQVEAYTVPETVEATEARRALRREQLQKQRAAEGTWVTSIEGRFAENAMKLALVRAVSRLPSNPTITAQDVAWGRAVTRHCVDVLLREAGQNVADTDYERKVQKLLKIIRQHGPLTEFAMVDRHSLGLAPRERAEMLNDLIKLGIVTLIQPDPTKRGPKSAKYMIAPATISDDEMGN